MLAATTPAPSQGTSVPGVTVAAPQIPNVDDHRLRDFVGRVVRPASDGHLARWSLGEHICPEVLGSETFGAVVSQRIRQEAQELGVALGGPRCEPDVVVILTDQPQPLLNEMRRRRPGIFGDHMAPALDAMIAKQEPVRIWQVTQDQPGDGDPENDTIGVGLMTRTFDHQSASRVTTLSRQTIKSILLVVDVNAVQSVTADALADYLTMAAFANVDQDADLGSDPTIMNLFRDEAAVATPPVALTSWDRAYLKGLYETRGNMIAGQQGASIVHIMTQSLNSSGPAPNPIR